MRRGSTKPDTNAGPQSVWIVNHYAIDPAQSSSGSRHFSLARRLVELGWSPTIFAASTEHPSGEQRQHAKRSSMDRQRDGVRFRFLRTPSYSSGFGRVINMLSFTFRLLLPAATKGLHRPQVVIGSTVHPLAAWAASVLARRAGVPFIFEVRDLWPQTLIDLGRLGQHSFAARLMRGVERTLCRRASAIITLLPFAHEYFEGHGIPVDKVTWISNGTDLDAFCPSVRGSDAGDEDFKIMYLGSVGRANGVDMILDAFLAATARNPRLRLEIVGSGSERAALQLKVAKSAQGAAVTFREPVVKSEVPQVVRNADTLVINILDLDVYRYGVSMNKIFDYAAAARPILIASNARNNFVTEAEAGIAVSAGDVGALSEAMVRMASPEQSSDRARWGSNARAHVAEHYDYRVLGWKLHHLLITVSDQKQRRSRATSRTEKEQPDV
ncbi:glycosyltransferase family 4 protein [Glaciibacter superstes]|uniref:glycosyltransferase family 4 protein n=1 Tax=Glaciibacter superstes TaxID=501023 RepID=UPI0003B53004|nr:glycosyltransferase family 4 protein [Glaciibacter superstes]